MKKNAVCIGEKWLPYRDNETEQIFFVHSVFDRIINISTDQGLLSVAADGIGGSSSFLTIADKFMDFGVNNGEQCVVAAGQICLAGCPVNFKNALVWKGPVNKEYRRNKIKSDNIAAFKAVLDRKASAHSAWKHIHSDSAGVFSGFRAIQKLKDDPLQAQNLIGLGMGLTPSGDDMLLGFLAIVNHISVNGAFLLKLRGVVSNSLEKTADISAQALANALDYEYHEYIQNCVRALCEGEKEDVYISAASLLKIGATSGSDIACGMYFGMMR